uniref:calcium uptake protein, mitochondrial-like n=1 Tax=Erigeron canadensis TaxID=72917 RepID=UPI001CB96EBD|nr:calcium uptake protein, mitochondrial-like [Erigeron canadensis]
MHFSSAFIRKKLFNLTTHPAIVSRIIYGHDHSTRLIATKSGNQPLSIGSVSNNERYKRVDSLIESLKSGIVVVGLSLGLCYFNYKSLTNSHFVYAYLESDKSTESEKKPTYILPDTYRRKVFFKYEKRIRTQSPPEKVFEYFASYRSPEGEPYMTPADLMRAVVPVFPPSEASRVREGSLKGELGPSELHCPPSEFFMLFDTNNDGLISFAEYIFFVTLLSIPESSFCVAFKMFDLDNDGEIDKEEFKKVMELMRAQHRQGVRHRDGLRNGLKVSRTVENGGLLEYFFGKDGKSRLAYGKFVQFLKDLHNEILSLEFAHYDYKSKGTISAKDFALSMVASADMGHINKFLDRVEELNDEPSLKSIRITLDDFMKFAELRTQLRPLSLAIFSYGKVNGLLTKKDFQRATEQVCGIALNDNVIDIIYYLFDVNRDGRLSSDEFLRVLQRREEDKLQPREAGLVGLISCWLQCSRSNCSTSRILF